MVAEYKRGCFSLNRSFMIALACSGFMTTNYMSMQSALAQNVVQTEMAQNVVQTEMAQNVVQNEMREGASAVEGQTVEGQTVESQDAANTPGDNVLQTVVVTAAGFEQNVKDAPASISVITREDLEKGSFRDLTDALKEVQGVAVSGTAGEKDIYIRGLSGSYTLILVDGKRQSTRDARTNGNSGYEQSFIPPSSAIERIEVVRGPMSSLYGSDAMGGVINIITRKIPTKVEGSFTVDGTFNQHSEYGNSGQLSYYLGAPIVNDVVGFQVWGRGLKRGEDEIASGNAEQKDVDITGKLTVTPNADTDLTFEAGHTNVSRYTNFDTDEPSYNNNTRDHWAATYTGRFDWTTAEFSILREDSERTTYSWDGAGSYTEGLRSPEIVNTVIDGKFTTPFELLGTHTLVTGGQWFQADLTDQNPGLRDNADHEYGINQWALFAEDEWWLTDDFALTGGIRMDDHEIYGNHFSPRGYAVWHATENFTLKGGISTGFRAPDVRSIAPGYAYTTGGRGCKPYSQVNPQTYKGSVCSVIIGGAGLKPETSTSYEFSVLYDNLDNLQFGATYFYTDFKDKITNQRIYDENGYVVPWDGYLDKNGKPYYAIFENLNIDDAVMQGVELTSTWFATDTLTFRGNYTYTDSEQKTGDYAGFALARTPKHMANIRADWQTPLENLDSWLSVNYHGEETNAGMRIGSNGNPVYNAAGKVVAREYPGYFTLDLGGSYNVSENVTFNAAIYNLFDKQITVDEYNDVMEGRRFWLSMTSQF